MKKVPRAKPFPRCERWEAMLKQHKTEWEKDPDYSSNWYETTSGPRRIMYNTGRDPGGYRGGFEGVYRVLDITKESGGKFKVKIFNSRYGYVEDTYIEPKPNTRKGQELKVGNWPVTGDQAIRALNWQKKVGLFRVT